MNCKIFSFMVFVMVIVVFESTTAQPQMPGGMPSGMPSGMPGGMPPMPNGMPSPPGMDEAVQTGQGFKDMGMSQIPGADSSSSSMNSE